MFEEKVFGNDNCAIPDIRVFWCAYEKRPINARQV